MLLAAGRQALASTTRSSKWFPELTRANEVTLRNLMSHTSGYEDYAPQDYTIPEWTKPTTAETIVHEWATKPLDFDPGTQYQYSNTNFNIVGLIVREGERRAVLDVPQVARARPAGTVARDRSRHAARSARANGLLPPRARPAAPGIGGGAGLVLRRRRDGDAGGRPAQMGHLDDERDAARAGVLRRDGNRRRGSGTGCTATTDSGSASAAAERTPRGGAQRRGGRVRRFEHRLPRRQDRRRRADQSGGGARRRHDRRAQSDAAGSARSLAGDPRRQTRRGRGAGQAGARASSSRARSTAPCSRPTATSTSTPRRSPTTSRVSARSAPSRAFQQPRPPTCAAG